MQEYATTGDLISIHAPRVGSDASSFDKNATAQQFQSTLPVWGATIDLSTLNPDPWNFNPRSPCGERQRTTKYAGNFRRISIHAPRVGSDLMILRSGRRILHFNPRSPCGERPRILILWPSLADFNPRSPCGERLQGSGLSVERSMISIHAPRVGSDGQVPGHGHQGRDISIHAPRVGSDDFTVRRSDNA